MISMLFSRGHAVANEQIDAYIENKKNRENTIQLIQLWNNINYQSKQFNDPYSIETWDKLLLEKYNWALKIQDADLIFSISIPLSFTYHSESKFKKGLPILEYLLRNKQGLNNIQYKEVLIKLEEEYRALHMIDKAIPIRQERINNKFINNYWEIYRDCGLYDAAKKELLAFVAIPPKYSTKRLSYYFLLGSLCVDLNQIDTAKLYFETGLKEAVDCMKQNYTTKQYEPNKLTYWRACFMGLIVRCEILKGNYKNAINVLKYDILESYENPGNKIDKMNLLAQTYIHFNQFKEAKLYLDSVNMLITEKNINPIQLEYLFIKSDYFSKVNKTDSALYYFKWYNKLKEEIYQSTQKNQSVLLLAQMEISNRRTELLEINQSLLKINKENSRQKIFLLGLFFCLMLSIIVAGIFFRNYFVTNKSKAKIEEQNRLINEHSLKIETQFNHNELLLKELHHRVKNNLQVMYSLLNLQKRRNNDEDTIETLLSIQNRIQTMALVHQNLYTSGDFKMVQISTYIKTLVNHLETIYKVEKKKTELQFFIEENLKLPIENVVAIGLIVNEAVSNSFKYAFKNKELGKITITITNNEEETEITIQDNGSGIDANQNSKKEHSLGLKLISLMCLQLKATHSMEQINGVIHKIKFKNN